MASKPAHSAGIVASRSHTVARTRQRPRPNREARTARGADFVRTVDPLEVHRGELIRIRRSLRPVGATVTSCITDPDTRYG